jgi:hypothetical protein
MKKISITFLVLLGLLSAQYELSERYHTYDEVQSQLEAWDEEFGENYSPSPAYPNSGIIYHLEEIGRSTELDLPFWGVRLSYGADEEQDKSRILFLGQCHAEEILGVEISMELINRFLNPTPSYDLQNMRAMLQASEIWVVPTYNPEGLCVVHGFDYQNEYTNDVSYRKNLTDVNHDGFFNYIVGIGNDSDGVDLNRNYDFAWVFGDDIWEPDHTSGSYQSHYDYYRGESPFSELEVQAIRDLAIDKNFVASVAYHSSRSGNVAEQIIYPWNWAGEKASPDFPVIDDIGINIASFIPKEVGEGNYIPFGGSGIKGNAHNWFYAELGCIQYEIEAGTENLQPSDIDVIEDTIERNLNGAFYLMNRAIGYPSGEFGASRAHVTGFVTDAQTGSPLHAMVTIEEMDGPMLTPRKCDDIGRYRRLLLQGSYNMIFSLRGYEPQTHIVNASNQAPSSLDVQLQPLPSHNLTINIENPIMLQTELVISDEYGEIQMSIHNGENTVELFENNYKIQIADNNYGYPQFYEIDLFDDVTISTELFNNDIVWDESFDNLLNWTIESGDWNIQNGRVYSQTELKYPNEIVSIVSNIIDVPDGEEFSLFMQWKYEVEWDNDIINVSVFTENDTVSIIKDGQSYRECNREYYHIGALHGDKRIRMEIIPDNTVEFRGIQMTKMQLVTEGSIVNSIEPSHLPNNVSITSIYPNPFNPETVIGYQLENSSNVIIDMYNIKGQLIETLVNNVQQIGGYHEVVWNASQFSTGIYIVKIQSNSTTQTQKLMLIK